MYVKYVYQGLVSTILGFLEGGGGDSICMYTSGIVIREEEMEKGEGRLYRFEGGGGFVKLNGVERVPKPVIEYCVYRKPRTFHQKCGEF